MSDPLFESREKLLDELRSIEAADQDRLIAGLAKSLSNDVDNEGAIGAITGNKYLDSIGIRSDSSVDITCNRARLSDYPADMPLREVLVLKDSSGKLVDPSSIDVFNRFIEGAARNQDNLLRSNLTNDKGEVIAKAGEYRDSFYRNMNLVLDPPKSMSEISIRLLNVLDDSLRSNDRTLAFYKSQSNKKLDMFDLAKIIKDGSTREYINSTMDCIAYPGLYERLRSVYIITLNHRLNEFFSAKVDAGEFNMSYSDLAKAANKCCKYAISKAQESIRIERIGNRVSNIFDECAEKQLTIAKNIKLKIENGQKTHTQYGKTIRLDPKKPIWDQVVQAQKNYVPWVGKKLDALVSKGLVEVAASAIAKRNGRDYVSSGDVDAALGAIASARKNVGEFDSIKGFVKRLAGPGNENFANAAAGYLQANAEKRQTMIGGVANLATKLATYSRGQIPASTASVHEALKGHRELATNPELAKHFAGDGSAVNNGPAAKRVRVNGEDRKLGHAVAATALLRANGGVPTLRQVNDSMSHFNLSVKAAQDQATKIRALNDGFAVRLGREERLNERQKIQRDIAARHHVTGGKVGGEVVLAGKKIDDKTAAAINAGLKQYGLKLRQTVEPEAPKPIKTSDDKAPKI